MSQPKVSIIVPVYNVEKYLERCVKSLTQQTLEELEIILVDDASTDASLEICKKFAAEDARVKVLHKENEGAGMARNAALQVATGTYIGFVDSDDFVEPDMYKTLYEKAEKYNSDLVMSGVIFVDGNMFSEAGETERRTFFEADTQFETEEDLKKLRMGIVGATPDDAEDSKYGMSIWKNLFRHEIIKKNNLVFESEREMLSEDAIFMIDYIACIRKATGIHEAFYNYFRNAASISKSYKKDRFEKSLVFARAVEERFQKDIAPKDYQVYINRFWQAMCRVLCSQEIMHAAEAHMPYTALKQQLKAICTHKLSVRALRDYPLRKLPFMQSVFAYAMKYRLYFVLKVLVGLRSK
ncbi:MAG: glycosyltransferase [Clostridia bacterium]|nr:glycosyltransferase [Clostridia bacterium]